jgi:hypothetical protein
MNEVEDMDYYEDLIRQRGEAEACAIAVDDARKLRRHLCVVRLMAAAAAARELCRRGIPAPSGTWHFAQGWSDLMREMRLARATDGPMPLEVLRIIAAGAPIGDAKSEILEAGLLMSRIQNGFLPPAPRQSEAYERGWQAACQALHDSHEARLLVEALAEAREVLQP